MKVKIKKLHKNAITPKYAKNGDAGLDLTAINKEYDENNNIVYKVEDDSSFTFEIPNKL